MTTEELRLMIQRGSFQYGSQIPIFELARLFNIEIPEPQEMNNYDRMIKFDLDMLQAYSVVNNELITIGRKLIKNGENYIVPTVGNTLIHVDRYEDKAARADLKARKLRRGFWAVNPDYVSDEDRARAARNHFRDTRRQGGPDEPPLR